MTVEFGDPRLPERFWSKVEPADNGCWMWKGAVKHQKIGDRRYATYTHEGRQRQLPMVVALVFIQPGYDTKQFRAENTCENKYQCANPEHITLISRADCKNGHKNPKRNAHNMCIECKREGERSRGPRPSGWGRKTVRRKTPKPIEGFTVFGDKPPGEIWRPAGWPKEVLGGRIPANQEQRESA